MADAFLGMRGTGDWATNERPESWDQKVTQLFPNGQAPLTAILGMGNSKTINDPVHHWYSKTMETRSGAVAGVYEDVGLADAYDAADDYAAGTTVYAKVAEALADEFRVGHEVMLRDSDNLTNDVVCKVTGVHKDGASSYLACRLLQADGTGDGDLSNCDRVVGLADINPEGGVIPSSIMYDPTEYSNYTQIIRTPLEFTNTALQTNLRTSSSKGKYADEKKDCLRRHSIMKEMALIFGKKSSGTGTNGKPERTMDGIMSFIRTYASGNIQDYRLEAGATYAGKTWEEAGKTWLEAYLEELFLYANEDVLCLCGAGVMTAINALAELYGNVNLNVGAKSYGIRVATWESPHGQVHFKTHPLFSQESSLRYFGLFLDPRNLTTLNLRPTKFYPDKSKDVAGFDAQDGIKEEFKCEISLKVDHPSCFLALDGFGKNNTN